MCCYYHCYCWWIGEARGVANPGAAASGRYGYGGSASAEVMVMGPSPDQVEGPVIVMGKVQKRLLLDP